jgi:hypothetical protein
MALNYSDNYITAGQHGNWNYSPAFAAKHNAAVDRARDAAIRYRQQQLRDRGYLGSTSGGLGYTGAESGYIKDGVILEGRGATPATQSSADPYNVPGRDAAAHVASRDQHFRRNTNVRLPSRDSMRSNSPSLLNDIRLALEWGRNNSGLVSGIARGGGGVGYPYPRQVDQPQMTPYQNDFATPSVDLIHGNLRLKDTRRRSNRLLDMLMNRPNDFNKLNTSIGGNLTQFLLNRQNRDKNGIRNASSLGR